MKKMQLKGIELKGTYKVGFYDKRFEIYDTKGNTIYVETSDGVWFKKEYDEKGDEIYYEDSSGYWFKKEYDEKGDEIYYEDNNGNIIDKRIKELTVNEIEMLLGYKIKIKGEKK